MCTCRFVVMYYGTVVLCIHWAEILTICYFEFRTCCHSDFTLHEFRPQTFVVSVTWQRSTPVLVPCHRFSSTPLYTFTTVLVFFFPLQLGDDRSLHTIFDGATSASVSLRFHCVVSFATWFDSLCQTGRYSTPQCTPHTCSYFGASVCTSWSNFVVERFCFQLPATARQFHSVFCSLCAWSSYVRLCTNW